MNAPAERIPFQDETLSRRLLAVDLLRLDVDQAQDRAADALVHPLAIAMLLGAALSGYLLTITGLDVTRLYAGPSYPALRVLLHNTLAVFFLSFPLVIFALKSRRGAALRRRLLAHRMSDIEAGARAYLQSVEGEGGLLWRFEDLLMEGPSEPQTPANGRCLDQEATERLVRASRLGDLQAVDLTTYRETIRLLQSRVAPTSHSRTFRAIEAGRELDRGE